MFSKKQRKASRKFSKHFHGNQYVGGTFLNLKEKEIMEDITIKHDQIPLNRVEKRAKQRQRKG